MEAAQSNGITKGGRPGCHHFGVTPFFDTKQKKQYFSYHWKCLAHWNGQKLI